MLLSCSVLALLAFFALTFSSGMGCRGEALALPQVAARKLQRCHSVVDPCYVSQSLLAPNLPRTTLTNHCCSSPSPNSPNSKVTSSFCAMFLTPPLTNPTPLALIISHRILWCTSLAICAISLSHQVSSLPCPVHLSLHSVSHVMSLLSVSPLSLFLSQS